MLSVLDGDDVLIQINVIVPVERVKDKLVSTTSVDFVFIQILWSVLEMEDVLFLINAIVPLDRLVKIVKFQFALAFLEMIQRFAVEMVYVFPTIHALVFRVRMVHSVNFSNVLKLNRQMLRHAGHMASVLARIDVIAQLDMLDPFVILMCVLISTLQIQMFAKAEVIVEDQIRVLVSQVTLGNNVNSPLELSFHNIFSHTVNHYCSSFRF